MRDYFSKALPIGSDEAVRRAPDVLQREGFCIVTEIIVKHPPKAKIGADLRNYRILGVYNPRLALETQQLNDEISTMLLCNVVVQELTSNPTKIAAIAPIAPMRKVYGGSVTDA
ncbi:MAG: DUF302 domain-containing protein [Pseudomonadota bacterium]